MKIGLNTMTNKKKKNSKEIAYKMLPLPSVFLMEAEFPYEHVNSLNRYLDDLLFEDTRRTAADTLVGQIQEGEQLRIDHLDERLKEVSDYLQTLGVCYVQNFFEMTGQQLDGNREVSIDELWSVHSYAGDYNPIHDHGTKTLMGISCTTWTKVPPQITQGPRPGSEDYGLYNASGESDGCLCFNYGQSSTWDRERLRPTQNIVVRPEVGKIYFFPSWMQHMVYPFRGDGERRTVAANLNCFPMEKNNEPTGH